MRHETAATEGHEARETQQVTAAISIVHHAGIYSGRPALQCLDSPLFACLLITYDDVAWYKALVESAAFQVVDDQAVTPKLMQSIWEIAMILRALFTCSEAVWRNEAAA